MRIHGLALFALLFLATLSFAVSVSAVTVTECGQLNDSDTYTLANNVNSTSDCFTLNSSITLDCAGFGINYSQGSKGHAVTAFNLSSITITNCNILSDLNNQQTASHAINFTNVTNGTVMGNNVTAAGSTSIALFIQYGRNVTILNNALNTTGAGTNKHAIQVGGLNVTIRNNSINARSNSSGNNGIRQLTDSNGLVIVDNRIQTNATNNAVGLALTNAGNVTIINNTVMTVGGTFSDGMNVGGQNVILGNIIQLNSTDGSRGIQIQGRNNTVRNNTIRTEGASDIRALELAITSSDSLVEGNFIRTNASSNSLALFFSSGSNSTVENNTIDAKGEGIKFTLGANNNFLRFNTIVARSGTGTAINVSQASNNNTFIGNNLTTGGSGAAVLISRSNDSMFRNTLFSNPALWITMVPLANATFTNTTFVNGNGSVRFIGTINATSSENVTIAKLNISRNAISINTTNLTFMNASAQLMIQNGSFTNPSPVYDPEDDGTFQSCPAEICTEVSYSGGQFIFNVSHFTGFSAQETETSIPPAPEFGSWVMIIMALGLVGAGITRMRKK